MLNLGLEFVETSFPDSSLIVEAIYRSASDPGMTSKFLSIFDDGAHYKCSPDL